MTETYPRKRRRRRRRNPWRPVIVTAILLLIVGGIIAGLVWLISLLFGEKIVYVESPLTIAEYMSINEQFPDDQGNTPDWVEIHNTGAQTVDVTGYTLTIGKKSVPLSVTSLKANERVRVFTANHLSEKGGEMLRLRDPEKAVAFETSTLALKVDTSAFLQADGTFAVTATPTPGYENTAEGFRSYLDSRHKPADGIAFNEIMASNKFSVTDKNGNYSDYIELLNTSQKTTDLKGYALTTDEAKPFMWRFPSYKVKAGETVLLFADGSQESKELYVSFKLAKEGGNLYLTNPAGYIVASVSFPELPADEAYVRDANGSYTVSSAISPGYENTVSGIQKFEDTLKTIEPSQNDLQISEVITRNTKYAALKGEYYDWIELYNPTGKDISLKGYSLAKSPTGEKGFKLPDTTIKAGEYLLVYASDGTVAEDSSAIQANFKLNGNCYIGLFSPKGKLLDGLRLTGMTQNVSKGRIKGQKGVLYFETPSPQKANSGGVSEITASPTFSKKTGMYDNVSSITVSLTGEGRIYYTTNGSKPTTASAVYTQPLTLTKTSVIRAIAVKEGALCSEVVTASYIINEGHGTDVVSLTADPEDLYSESRGIYATGPKASSVFPYSGANFWQDWERDANVELFSKDGSEPGFNVGCGIKIFGAYSRAYSKKSFKLCFRDQYGAGKLRYNVFDNRDISAYDILVLRAGGQDAYKAVMKDEVITGVVDDAGILDTQAYRPVVLYVNGEYFGMYYIREKINDHFIADHYGVSEESVDILQGTGKTARFGSAEDYKDLVNYIKTHDLSNDEYYDHVISRLDPVNYADYVIAEIWCGNTDQGNIRFFRTTETDGRWRWILFDTDLGFQHGTRDSVWEYIDPDGNGHNNAFSTAVFNGLIKNKRFRDLFVERLEYGLNNVYRTDLVLAKIDSIQESWHGEGTRNHAKWECRDSWDVWVNGLRSFARGRIATLKKEFTTDSRVTRVFHLTDDEIKRCFGDN